MGKVTTGFKEFERQDETYTAVKDRVKHYKEFTVPFNVIKTLLNKDLDAWIAAFHFVIVVVRWGI